MCVGQKHVFFLNGAFHSSASTSDQAQPEATGSQSLAGVVVRNQLLLRGEEEGRKRTYEASEGKMPDVFIMTHQEEQQFIHVAEIDFPKWYEKSMAWLISQSPQVGEYLTQ